MPEKDQNHKILKLHGKKSRSSLDKDPQASINLTRDHAYRRHVGLSRSSRQLSFSTISFDAHETRGVREVSRVSISASFLVAWEPLSLEIRWRASRPHEYCSDRVFLVS